MAVNQVRNWFPLIWFSLFCLAILHLGIRRLGARFKCSYLLRYRTQSGSLPTILTRRTFISALIALLHYLNSTTWILLSCQTQLYTTNVLKCLESILKFIEPFSFYFFVLFSIRQRLLKLSRYRGARDIFSFGRASLAERKQRRLKRTCKISPSPMYAGFLRNRNSLI